MSSTNFKRSFVNPLVKRLDAEVRKKVERQQGQLVLLPNLDSLVKVLTVNGIEFSPEQLNAAYREAKSTAARLQKVYISTSEGKRRYNILRDKWDTIKFKTSGMVLNENAFLVSNFESSVNTIKKSILDQFILGSKRDSVSKSFQKGHGEEGLAVSQVQVASAFARASALDGISPQDLANVFKSFIDEAEITQDYKEKSIAILKELRSSYVNVVTKAGKLQANYFSIITFQSEQDNQLDKNYEQAFITQFRRFIKSTKLENFVRQENSPSINNKLKGYFADSLERNIKKGLVGKSRLPKPGVKSSGKATRKQKVDSPPLSMKRVNTARITPVKQKKTKSSVFNLSSLMALINAKLPAIVRNNMSAPALEFRTGRFASSVQVTDITQTAKGFPSIGYTYMRNPYQTFEPGWAQGSFERDPKKLIDRSIREIAKDLIGGRFYTRRV